MTLINFNLVRDGKYHARLVGLNRTLGKFGEQYKFTWSLYRDAEEREHAGVIDVYKNVNRALYEYFAALGWPNCTVDGVDLKMTANAVTLPLEIVQKLYSVEVETVETKAGNEKQQVALLNIGAPQVLERKRKGGKS
jgi:hypothetical protein